MSGQAAGQAQVWEQVESIGGGWRSTRAICSLSLAGRSTLEQVMPTPLGALAPGSYGVVCDKLSM